MTRSEINKRYREKHVDQIRNYNRTHREMQKHRNLRFEHGISLEQYNELFSSQNGLCKGCYRHQSSLKMAFAVDHNHKTGKIRGLLCGPCNTALGLLKDSPETLQRLIDYLK